MLSRRPLHCVPLNVLLDIQKSKMESTNAALAVKSVQMELTSTVQVKYMKDKAVLLLWLFILDLSFSMAERV